MHQWVNQCEESAWGIESAIVTSKGHLISYPLIVQSVYLYTIFWLGIGLPTLDKNEAKIQCSNSKKR